jgi:acyl-CoA thioester hydrolase
MIHPYVDETQVRVRYAETDAMGVVHHSQYVIWFEVGRSSFMRGIGHSYADVERLGYLLVLAELGVRYLRPAHYDELITVRTQLTQLRSRSVTFSYTIVRPDALDESEQVLATGLTRLICTDRQGQVQRLPAPFRAVLEPYTAKLAAEPTRS